MGNKCSCGISRSENEIDLALGLSLDGITQNYQYHDSHISEKGIKMDQFDMFYYKYTNPMNWVNLEDFLEKIDILRTKDGKVQNQLEFISFDDF